MTMAMDYRCDYSFRRILCRASRQRSVLHPSSIEPFNDISTTSKSLPRE